MTNDLLPPDLIDEKGSDERLMSWVGHLSEARHRLIICIVFFCIAFLCIYPFSGVLLNLLLLPLGTAMHQSGGAERAIFTGVAEGFITHLKIAAFGAVLTSFPVVLFQIWRFIRPAMYENEKSFIKPLFFVAPLLFIAGACFVYFALTPMAFKFLLSFQQLGAEKVPVVLEARVAEYLSFMTTLILAFGISFQLPIVLIILAKMGIISSDNLVQGRRYAIVLIFIVAAILTPPDVVSQFALALPLIILYEGAILSIRSLEKNTN